MNFDVIVIGTGMGGGAVGRVLSEAGMRVLFLEKGLGRDKWNVEYAGQYPEVFLNEKNRTQVFSEAGRSTVKVNNWVPVLGGGAGGGTSVYGAGLLPFQPDDTKDWPQFSFSELSRYYQKVDELFRPNGSQDPLHPERRNFGGKRDLSPSGRELFDFFKSKNLNPFLAPIGFENVADCQQCFGSFCAKDCKKTAANIFVEPALKTGKAEVRYATTAEKLLVDSRRIVGVQCKTSTGTEIFTAKWFFWRLGHWLLRPFC